MDFDDAEDAILELVRGSEDGSIGGHQLGSLYRQHAGLRECIDHFGGARRFCERSEWLEFISDSGSGHIREDSSRKVEELEDELAEAERRMQAAEANAQELQDALDRLTADAQRELAEVQASRSRALKRAAEAKAEAAAEVEAAEQAAASATAIATLAAQELLTAATAAEAKDAGLEVGAQVCMEIDGKIVETTVIGYAGSRVRVEDSGKKTFLLAGETIAKAAKIASEKHAARVCPDIVTWECDVNGSWTSFTDALSLALESARASTGVSTGVFQRGGYSYAVDWQKMVQINEETRVERAIRRTVRPGKVVARPGSFGGMLQASPTTPVESIAFLSATIQKYTLKHTGPQIVGEFEDHHLGVAFKQLIEMFSAGSRQHRQQLGARMLGGYGHQPVPRISRVEFFDNPFLQRRFEATKGSMSCEEQWVFHGTASEQVAQNIMLEGFLVAGDVSHITGAPIPVANGNSYGCGVYTAQGPDTPMAYMKSSKCIVLARALLGNHAATERGGGGVDSWTPSSHPDWVIFARKELLLPCYLVYFE